MKAGKVYVPLDPSHPPARLQFILADSQAALLLTETRHSPLATTLASAALQRLNLDTLDLTLSPPNPALPLTPGTLASLLYTSGSTGQPKGVVQNHGNTLHDVMNYIKNLGLHAQDRLPLLWSVGTMGSGRSILGALLTGASLWPYDLSTEGMMSLAAWLQHNRLTIVDTVVTVFRQMVDGLRTAEQCATVRRLRLGSEPLTIHDVALFRGYFSPSCLLYNAFGATETGSVSQYIVDHHMAIPGHMVPAGYVVESMGICIVDDSGTSLGPNEVGEIVVRSRYLALGYWRRPDLTAAAFLPAPDDDDARLYRTGDFGRLRSDGCLEHLGRRDAQVQIRGQRVDMMEVELVLAALPTLKQVAVVIRERTPSDVHLVAYVVPA